MGKDDNQAVLNKLAKGTSITFGGVIVGVGAQFFVRIVLARSLGPQDYGRLMLGLSILYILSAFCKLGLDIGIARFIPQYITQRDFSRLKGTILSTTTFPFFLSSIIGIIVYFFSSPIALHIFNDLSLTVVIKVFALILPFFTTERVLVGGLRGFERMDYLTYTNQFTKQIGLVIITLLALWSGLTVFEVSIGYAIVFVAMFILGIYFLRKIILKYKFWQSTKQTFTLKKMLRFSWPLIFSQQLSQFRKRADTLFLGYFTTSTLVGAFNVAMPLARLLQLVISAVNKALMPSASKLHAENKFEDLKKIYKLTSFWTFFLTFPIYLVIVFNARFIINLLFGAEYLKANITLIILATGFFINSASGSFGEIFIVLEKTKINLIISLIALCINVILNIILIPYIRLMGAAIAASFSLIIATSIGVSYLYTQTRLQPFYRNHLVVVITSIVIIPIASFVVANQYSLIRLLGLIIAIIVGMFINYKLLNYFNLLKEEEKIIIRKSLNKLNLFCK